MLKGALIGVFVAAVFMLLRTFLPAPEKTHGFSKEEIEELKEEFEELFAGQGFITLAVFIGIILLGQTDAFRKLAFTSASADMALVGLTFLLLGLAPFSVPAIYFRLKGPNWASGFNDWASKKYRFNFVKALRGLVVATCLLGAAALSYGFYLTT